MAPEASVAEQWIELLGVKKTTEKDDQDFEDIARDAMAGKIGPRKRVVDMLTTLAHQIGRRKPKANKPIGVFIAEVGKLRRAAAAAVAPRREKRGQPHVR